MMKISRYLFVIFVSGIFVVSVSAVCAQQRFPAKAPQSATSGEEGGKAGIIIVDGTVGSEGVEGRASDTSIESGDIFQPSGADTLKLEVDVAETPEVGSPAQPRRPDAAPKPATTLKPGGPDTLQQKDVPRGQRSIGGVIPPDFDDDTTNR